MEGKARQTLASLGVRRPALKGEAMTAGPKKEAGERGRKA